MSKILILGNVVKDIYLKLDERKNDFEEDENGVSWLNLGFDGEGHEFFHQHNVFGGAAISLEVLEKFGFSTKIAGTNGEGFSARENRFILSMNTGTSYFVQEKKTRTIVKKPNEETKLIYIDRSAAFTEDFAEKVLEVLNENPKILLTVYAPKNIGEKAKELIERSRIVFADTELPRDIKNKNICYLKKDGVRFGDKKIDWRVEKIDLKTHLTIYSIAAATFIGCMLKGEKLEDTLRIVKVNVEKSNLNGTIGFSRLKDFVEIEKRDEADLKLIAKTLVSFPKGILAADESGGSIHKKFESMNIPDDEKHRRDYRNIFFTTKDLEKYVNGVILFDETTKQRADNGLTFTELLTGKGIIPGVKVDQGLVNFTNSEEKYTQGLDGLRERLNGYYKMGLRFAKWRAAFEINESAPSDFAIEENCRILAEYAADCQAEKIVPIVEPEVVYDGDYSLGKNIEVTSRILKVLFEKLAEKNVSLPGTILKVNMVLAGKKFPVQSTPEEVGKATADVLRECVPDELAGVVFLSGGQSVEQATENLQAVTNNGPFPWPVTFSFARALQDPALFAWKGDNENADEARKGFRERLVANCEALRKK